MLGCRRTDARRDSEEAETGELKRREEGEGIRREGLREGRPRRDSFPGPCEIHFTYIFLIAIFKTRRPTSTHSLLCSLFLPSNRSHFSSVSLGSPPPTLQQYQGRGRTGMRAHFGTLCLFIALLACGGEQAE
ncbi:hypothetical protein E2C01_023698 [Portunus trituberculatus]|uniref:Uncharacterized protein n=1 Tax=Portunus trituberculatus TaxID=210409 RepID=A0A5B7ECA8_PORTR|nr:hypothetical protein [Portunus trituberculatus]